MFDLTDLTKGNPTARLEAQYISFNTWSKLPKLQMDDWASQVWHIFSRWQRCFDWSVRWIDGSLRWIGNALSWALRSPDDISSTGWSIDLEMPKVHQSLSSAKLCQSHPRSRGKSSRKCRINRRTTRKDGSEHQRSKANGSISSLRLEPFFRLSASFPLGSMGGKNSRSNRRWVHRSGISNDTNRCVNVKCSKISPIKKRFVHRCSVGKRGKDPFSSVDLDFGHRSKLVTWSDPTRTTSDGWTKFHNDDDGEFFQMKTNEKDPVKTLSIEDFLMKGNHWQREHSTMISSLLNFVLSNHSEVSFHWICDNGRREKDWITSSSSHTESFVSNLTFCRSNCVSAALD